MYNSRLRPLPGKLRTRWSGPHVINRVFPYVAVELLGKENRTSKVNGQRLKHYIEGERSNKGKEKLFLEDPKETKDEVEEDQNSEDLE